MDDIIINKIESIRRCIKRVFEDYDEEFEYNYTKQDAVILNLQRAIQQTIDLGAYLIKKYKFSTPTKSSEIFEILYQHKIIDKELSLNLQKMVGFRNIAIHEYSNLDLEIVEYVIDERISDIYEFIQKVKEYESND